MSKEKLNLGAGTKNLEGYINVDNRKECNPEVIHDLNIIPYPFADSQFSEVIMDHAIEHLSDPLAVLGEIYRISEPNAMIYINCPHFSGNWVHPGHKSAISVHLFDFLRPGGEEVYGNANFELEKVELRWFRYLIGRRANPILKILNYLINIVANLSPSFTERFLCYSVGGFEEIRFTARVVK